jgi:hypothetical protein
MVHSVAESRNRDDQGPRTVNSRDRANETSANDTIIDKIEDDDIELIRIGTLDKMNMDIVLLTEIKRMNEQHTKRAFK